MAELTLSASEQRAILASPRSIMLLMYWHDYQQTCAEASDMDCTGNRDRYEELKAHGRAIIDKEGADSFDNEVLRAFDIPVPEHVLAARRINAAYPAGVTTCSTCGGSREVRGWETIHGKRRAVVNNCPDCTHGGRPE